MIATQHSNQLKLHQNVHHFQDDNQIYNELIYNLYGVITGYAHQVSYAIMIWTMKVKLIEQSVNRCTADC